MSTGLAAMLAISRAEVARLEAEVERLTCLVADPANVPREEGTKLTLPWPPSINHYWRSRWTGKFIQHYIAPHGRKFRHEVIRSLSDWDMLLGPLAVHVDVFPPDRRARDLDNICKGLLDALVHAGVFEDEGRIAFMSSSWQAKREQTPAGFARAFYEANP